jgi:1,4-alpha-glucan branching enzyme
MIFFIVDRNIENSLLYKSKERLMNFVRLNYYLKNYIIALLILLAVSAAFAKAPESNVKHVAWSKNVSIYEMNVRQYSKEGTFRAAEKRLPELKKMGIGIVWLMPVNPIGELNRKGTLGSYYSVKDYRAVNPEFGTKKDLKDFVKRAHSLGLKVILDWVANHTSWDNQLIKDHPDYYTKDKDGKIVSPVPDWKDCADLNYDNQGLRKYMTDALKYWIKECDIDGYRCDVAAMVPTDFWDAARKELDKVKPVFMLAEAWEPELQANAFDMTYSWDMHHLFNDIAQGKKTAVSLDTLIGKESVKYPAGAYRMQFTSNHDENSWNGTEYERLGKGVEAFAVLAATMEGIPLVYSGQEAGFNKRLEFFEKDPIVWKSSPMRQLYTKLLNLKIKNRALWNGSEGGKLIKLSPSNDKAVFAFSRAKEQNKVIVILNLSGQEQKVTVNGDSLVGNFKGLFDGKNVKFSQKESFTLKPWEYRVYYK